MLARRIDPRLPTYPVTWGRGHNGIKSPYGKTPGTKVPGVFSFTRGLWVEIRQQERMLVLLPPTKRWRKRRLADELPTRDLVGRGSPTSAQVGASEAPRLQTFCQQERKSVGDPPTKAEVGNRPANKSTSWRFASGLVPNKGVLRPMNRQQKRKLVLWRARAAGHLPTRAEVCG